MGRGVSHYCLHPIFALQVDPGPGRRADLLRFCQPTYFLTAASPPAQSGLLVFPTSAMFPPVRPFHGGKR
jgi:hypothetical protein